MYRPKKLDTTWGMTLGDAQKEFRDYMDSTFNLETISMKNWYVMSKVSSIDYPKLISALVSASKGGPADVTKDSSAMNDLMNRVFENYHEYTDLIRYAPQLAILKNLEKKEIIGPESYPFVSEEDAEDYFERVQEMRDRDGEGPDIDIEQEVEYVRDLQQKLAEFDPALKKKRTRKTKAKKPKKPTTLAGAMYEDLNEAMTGLLNKQAGDPEDMAATLAAQEKERKKRIGRKNRALLNKIATTATAAPRGLPSKRREDTAPGTYVPEFEIGMPIFGPEFLAQDMKRQKKVQKPTIAPYKVFENALESSTIDLRQDVIPIEFRALVRRTLLNTFADVLSEHVLPRGNIDAQSLALNVFIPYEASTISKNKTPAGKYVVQWTYKMKEYRRFFDSYEAAQSFSALGNSFAVGAFYAWTRVKVSQRLEKTKGSKDEVNALARELFKSDYLAFKAKWVGEYETIGELLEHMVPVHPLEVVLAERANQAVRANQMSPSDPSRDLLSFKKWALESTKEQYKTEARLRKRVQESMRNRYRDEAREDVIKRKFIQHFKLHEDFNWDTLTLEEYNKIKRSAFYKSFADSVLFIVESYYDASVEKYNQILSLLRAGAYTQTDKLDEQLVEYALTFRPMPEFKSVAHQKTLKELENDVSTIIALQIANSATTIDESNASLNLMMHQIVLFEDQVYQMSLVEPEGSGSEGSPTLLNRYTLRMIEPLVYMSRYSPISKYAEYIRARVRRGLYKLHQSASMTPVDYFPEFFLSQEDPAVVELGHKGIDSIRKQFVQNAYSNYLALVNPFMRIPVPSKLIRTLIKWDKYIKSNVGQHCMDLGSGWLLVNGEQVPTDMSDIVIGKDSVGNYRCYSESQILQLIADAKDKYKIPDPYEPKRYLSADFVDRMVKTSQ